MTTYAITYTFVVEVEEGSSVTDAVEEYIHSNDALSNPTEIEELID